MSEAIMILNLAGMAIPAVLGLVGGALSADTTKNTDSEISE